MLEKVMDYTPIGYCLIPLNRKDWLWRINVLLPDIIDSVYESRKPVFGEDTYYGTLYLHEICKYNPSTMHSHTTATAVHVLSK